MPRPAFQTSVPTAADLQTTVKNTFLEIVEPKANSRSLLRSKSEDDLSCSSSSHSSGVVSYSSYKGHWLRTSMLPPAGPPSDSEERPQFLEEKRRLDAAPKEISPWAQSLVDPADVLFSPNDLLALGDGLVGRDNSVRGSTSSPQKSASTETRTRSGGSRIRPMLQQRRVEQQARIGSDDVSSDRSISSGHALPEGSRGERARKASVAPAGADETSEALVERYGVAFDIPREVLQELEQRGCLRDIPISETGLTSVGSISHAKGTCNPCPYWFRDMCTHGVRCHQCHFVHEGQKPKRFRPSKNTRHRIRELEEATREGKVVDKEYLRNLLAYGIVSGSDSGGRTTSDFHSISTTAGSSSKKGQLIGDET